MARSDDGQDGGFGRRFWCVCVVPCWVGVTPTCINELMRRLMLAFKSPLVLWPLCPPLLSCFSFFHTNTLFAHTVNITHARSLIYIGGGRRAASLSRKHSWWWNEEECARMFVFYVCMKGGGWGGAEYGTSMCACFHMYVDSENREWDVMKLLPDLLLYILLMIISSFFIFFFLVFFPVLSPSPLKKKTLRFLFRQPARPSKCTIAFLCELSCFPVC